MPKKHRAAGAPARQAGSIQSKIVGGYLGLYVVIWFTVTAAMILAAYVAFYYTLQEQAWRDLSARLEDVGNMSADAVSACLRDNLPDYIGDCALLEGDRLIASRAGLPAESYLEWMSLSRCNQPLLSLGRGTLYFRKNLQVSGPGEASVNWGVFFLINLSDYIGGLPLGGSFLLLIPITGAVLFAAGLIVFLIFGSAQTRRYLSPIREITRMTAQLNDRNLNLRLNAETARYELKDMVLTINSMLDRIHAGMAKQKAFVSDVSHELRTPLSVINGYAHILERWAREDEKVFDESVSAIISESDNMKYLVENLLFLVRSDNNALLFDKETFDLSILAESIHRETLLLDRNTHQITAQISEGVMLYADRAKLKQALRIFMENALKYTPPDGRIRLSLSPWEKGARVVIEDTGIGISAKDMGQIFVRFYRGDRSRSRQTGGYGLGLPIARTILTAHGGKIRMTSREGQGTTVEVLLPGGEPPPPSPVSASTEEEKEGKNP